ncbi:MAG: hypothetical protein CMJ84_07255 [Planctomycetes bacterium]|nr:hypothetical protein [Planctomycetota bacterium]
MIATLASLPLWIASAGSALLAANPSLTPAIVASGRGFAPDPAPSNAPRFAQDGAARGADDGSVPLIQDLGEFYLLTFDEQEDGLSLKAFIKICQQETEINFYTNTENAQALDSISVSMFGSKRILKKDFYSFFQIIMIINRYVCKRIGPEHLSVVVVESLDTGQGRGGARADSIYVSPGELPLYADQPATLIQTVVVLPNIEVRTLANSMRQLAPDPNTMTAVPVGDNTVILQGFGSNIAALVRMLELVDEASKAEDPVLPEFEVIKLAFASADEIAETLEELLEASQRATRGANQQNRQQQGATASIRQGEVETKIMVDPRTNSLLVMAMPDEMPRIMELVARLDTDEIDRERTYHFYNLENAEAEELSEVLDEFLQDANRIQTTGQGGGQRQGSGQTSSSSSTEVAVVPDPATNSLLIAAGRTRYEEILDLIERLDRRQDQVLIETALIELSGRDTLDLGVELGGASIPGASETGGFGITDFGLSTFQDNDLDGVPDTRVPNIATGITAGILDGDDFQLPILIRALEEKRNTNVLNIPSVLVNNNMAAVVRTLDEQPTTTITASGGVGGQTQENFANYQEAGISLQISPAISASGYLRLEISLSVSSFLGTFQGAIPPPRITREIQTTVNVPDGDTMVIGGIIVDNRNDTTNRIPLLGDIPILGRLFRRDTEVEDRTSLYFFVTPHIMLDREFADLSTYSYDKKLEAADAIGSKRIRMIDSHFGEAQGELDLGGFDVPLFQPPARGEVTDEALGKTPGDVNEMLSEDGE